MNARRWQSYLFKTLWILQDPWVLFGFNMIIAHEESQKLVFVTIETKWNDLTFFFFFKKQSKSQVKTEY